MPSAMAALSANISGGQILPDMSMNFDGSKYDDVLLPKAQIGYHWTPDFMTYAGITRGYRSGGFNTTFLSMEDMSFGPEYSWNYEVGFKSSWLNNRLNFNTSLFYIDLDDQQVTETARMLACHQAANAPDQFLLYKLF